MPYTKIGELPERVKDNLPKNAQKIFKEAYNNAWDQYSDPEKEEMIRHRKRQQIVLYYRQ